MSRKLITKIVRKRMEGKNKAVVEETDLSATTSWDFGSIALTCKCGRTQTLMEHVQYGIQFIVTTNNKSGVTLHCDKCHSELRLHCIEGTPAPDAIDADAEVVTEPVIELLTDEETAQKIAENPNVEVIESIPATNENVPQTDQEGEPV